MSAPKMQGVGRFSVPSRRLLAVWQPGEVARSEFSELVAVFTLSDDPQTSYSDHPKKKARNTLPYRMAIRNHHGETYRKITAMGADQFFDLAAGLDALGLVGKPVLIP